MRSRSSSLRSTRRSHAQSHRVTRMLILVSTCFLILNAPSHICSISLELYTLRKSVPVRNNQSANLLNYSNETLFDNSTSLSSMILRTNSDGGRRKMILLQLVYITLIISKHIAYLSYSINFFLYSFCGMKFRGELMKYFTRYGRYRRQRKTSRVVMRENSV